MRDAAPIVLTAAREQPPTTALARSDTAVNSGFRPELHGLRALASILVVVYHVWLGRVSGGVDVFFVLSGFLITGQLTRALARGGIDYRAMWARMIRRLVPAAVTVLLGCVVAGVLLLPENRWLQTIREVTAAAVFAENWQLARDSTDYFAQHDEATPVQHFWSLSVQGQFYLVWPLLIGLVAWLHRRLGRGAWSRRSLEPVLGVVLVALFAVSLGYSVWLTRVDQPLAYFHSLARAWEFALGGLLALAIHHIVLPRVARIVLGWLGVVGLLACGLVFQVGQVFPGYAALWPALCSVAVLVAGRPGCAWGADRLLTSRGAHHLGDLSFSLYLWHWPVLVLYLVGTDRDRPGALGGCAVIALALVLAALTNRLIERPLRVAPARPAGPWRDCALAGTAVLALLVAVGGWQTVSAHKARSYALTVGDPDHPGAVALTPGFEYWGSEDAKPAPSFVTLSHDWVSSAGMDCVMSPRGAGLLVCSTRTASPPARKVVLVGDSHPAQFLAALRPIAEERNWQLIFMSRGGCAFSADSDITPWDQGCLDWNAAALEEILSDRPDFVFTAASRDVRVGLTEHTPSGYVERWRRLADEHIPVLAARDNPRFTSSPSRCVESKGRNAPACVTPRSELFAARAPYLDAPDVPPTVRFLDFSNSYCDPEACLPVVGNVLVYMDDNHVSATYLATMTPIVEHAIDEAITDLQLGHFAS
ncbi:MAG: acyltransferase family protein [Pseudonocardiales bacterium]|nr:acyltransferase family protein [Pseudonocardiales bacterium]